MDNRHPKNYSAEWIYRNTSRSQELFSKQFNERVAARMSAGFLRLGIEPNIVTTLGLLAHVVTAAAILSLPADSMLPAAVIGFVGWQLAFTLDCSDGQVARAAGKGSPEGAVVDLLADYLSHAIVLMIVWVKIVALTSLAEDALTPGWAALVALSSGGWFAAVHNQATAGPSGARAGVLQRHIGERAFFRFAYQCRHLLDTSLIITALALAMALDGYLLLGVFLVAAALRLLFISVRFVSLVLLSPKTERLTDQESSIV